MKKIALGLIALCLSAGSQASYDQAPPSFKFKDGNAVFVDIQSSDVEITYDIEAKTASVASVLTFYSANAGYPIIDLVPNPTEVLVDDLDADSETVKDPDQQTTVRIIKAKVNRGYHQIKIKHQLTNNVVFSSTGVSSGFWMSDLTDRRYLEQYLPANFEFDQFATNIKVSIVGANEVRHDLKANGIVTKIDTNTFEVKYPAFYSASSYFFHLFPESAPKSNVQFYYQSIDGRAIPVDIYTNSSASSIDSFVAGTKTILAELENDYGAWPHEHVIIYGNSTSGGMEHSGATATSLSALGHELFHSYHARGLMPANGNAGWMDEAIARFRDNKYPLVKALTFSSTQLAGHSIWARMTDRMAYTEGSAFLSWVHFRMTEKGLSFKTFLRDYFQQYKYTTVTTELFKNELIQASGLDLSGDFDQYIYGKGNGRKPMKFLSTPVEEDPMHPKLSKEELLKLTTM